MTKLNQLLLMSSILAIGGCGGGSSSSSPPAEVGPTASFSASTESGNVPLEINFTSTSEAGSADITTFLWDFGDGTTSTDENPSHTYTVAGDFDVTLMVTTSVSSDDEDRAGFIDVIPSSAAIEPAAVEVFEVDGQMIEAAKNQVLISFAEDATEAEREMAFEAIEALGGGIQSFDEDTGLAQVFAPDDEELSILDGLGDLAGVESSSLNFALQFNASAHTDNAAGFKKWKQIYQGKAANYSALSGLKVEIDSSFAGGYWIDQINLETGLSELEGVALDANQIAIVDTGLPAGQLVVEEARVTRVTGDGDALTDDDTFGTTGDDETHGRDVIGFSSGAASMVTGVNATSDVISVDVFRARTFLGLEIPFLSPFVTDLSQGIVTAIDGGANVVNVSWGAVLNCTSPKANRLASQRAFRDSVSGAVNYARRNNTNIVFSSGNHCEKEDDQLLTNANSPNNDSWASHALIVGASNVDRNDACFSVMGDVVDLSAPGESVGYGDGRTLNGTSFAAPIVAGAISLIKSVNNTLSAPEAKSIVLDTVNNNLVGGSLADNQADATCPSTSDENAFPDDGGVSDIPTGILNFGGAVNTALLAQDIDLASLDVISLGLGETTTVPLEVTLPEAGVAALDLVFLIDRSGSYADDINTLQSQAESIISSLSDTGIDIQFGVAGFADFPISPFGSSADEPFSILQTLTSDSAAAIAGIDALDQPLQSGNDSPESQYEALFQVASNALGFREGALPVILFATDADFHDSDVETTYPGAGRTETLDALRDNNITVFGLQSGGSSSATVRLNELATETDGQVFNLDSASSEIATAISDAVNAALQEADITLRQISGSEWITNVTPLVHEDVQAGETVTFDVEFTGIRNADSIVDLDYEVYLWAFADEEALITRSLQLIDVE